MGPRRLICAALVLAVPSLASAYERDSHYYLRFALSLSTCFDWEESHLIASGDWGMDENRVTHAEMNPAQRKNKIQWHAFGHSDDRFHELWQRSLEETDLEYRLVKLGKTHSDFRLRGPARGKHKAACFEFSFMEDRNVFLHQKSEVLHRRNLVAKCFFAISV